jgi:hypothetical protein
MLYVNDVNNDSIVLHYAANKQQRQWIISPPNLASWGSDHDVMDVMIRLDHVGKNQTFLLIAFKLSFGFPCELLPLILTVFVS